MTKTTREGFSDQDMSVYIYVHIPTYAHIWNPRTWALEETLGISQSPQKRVKQTDLERRSDCCLSQSKWAKD